MQVVASDLNGFKQENHAIAKITVRCTQYMSALKIVCKRKISRRGDCARIIDTLHTILLSYHSVVKLFSNVSTNVIRVPIRYVTDGQTE